MNNKRIKVKDHPNLERDPNSTAIVSTDKDGYKKYISERNLRIAKDKRIEELESRLLRLEALIAELPSDK